MEELFGSPLPKEAPQSTSSSVGDGMRGPAFGPSSHSVEPLLTPRLSADPGGSALVSLFQACGTRDPRPAASNTEESQSRSTSQSVRRGSAGPLPPVYMNPLTDGHGMAVTLPGFMPGPLVTPQSFRESTCKAPGPFTGKAALLAQVNTPSSVFMVCVFLFIYASAEMIYEMTLFPSVQEWESLCTSKYVLIQTDVPVVMGDRCEWHY